MGFPQEKEMLHKLENTTITEASWIAFLPKTDPSGVDGGGGGGLWGFFQQRKKIEEER